MRNVTAHVQKDLFDELEPDRPNGWEELQLSPQSAEHGTINHSGFVLS
jgi:hypothetical protein